MNDNASAASAPPRRGNTVDYIFETLRDGILEGHFAPGQRLIEADLTRDLGVSRGPLREALRRLAAEGIVDIVSNRGALVHRFSRKEVADLFLIRQALEGLAAQLAARNIAQGDNRARFRSVLEQIDRSLGSKIGSPYSEGNRIFHDIIVELSDNPKLGNLIRQLKLPLVRFQLRGILDQDYWKRSMREHEILAAAILAGDPRRAETAMRRHLQRAGEQILALPPSAFAPVTRIEP